MNEATKAKLTRHGNIKAADTAEANTYTVHYFVDGDETIDSELICAGPDYAVGDLLKTIAKERAERAEDNIPRSSRHEQVEAVVLCDCCNYELASAVAYRWDA